MGERVLVMLMAVNLINIFGKLLLVMFGELVSYGALISVDGCVNQIRCVSHVV